MELKLSETDENLLTHVFELNSNPNNIKQVKFINLREPETLFTTLDLFMSEILGGKDYNGEIKTLIENARKYRVEPNKVEKYINSLKFKLPGLFSSLKNIFAERLKKKTIKDLWKNSLEIYTIYTDNTVKLKHGRRYVGNEFFVIQPEDVDEVLRYASTGKFDIGLDKYGRATARLTEYGKRLLD